MSAEKRSITKCNYRYSQINNFISVKDFMFVRENGVNHLLIRFCNLSDFTINALTFSIIELDASGKILGKLKVSEESLNILPGNTYTPQAGFKVPADCCDCKIVIHRVTSGNYIYRTIERKIVTDYCKPQGELIEGGNDTKPRNRFYVKSKHSKKAKSSGFLAIVLLFTIIIINAARPFILYYEDDIKQLVKNYTETYWAEGTDSADTNESSSLE